MQSLATGRRDRKQDRPTGFKNTGTDCFALSLFRLLARQSEWRRVFDEFAPMVVAKDLVVRILERFHEYMETRKVEAF